MKRFTKLERPVGAACTILLHSRANLQRLNSHADEAKNLVVPDTALGLIVPSKITVCGAMIDLQWLYDASATAKQLPISQS